MKRTGRVQTCGTVAGKSLNIKWNAMKVKVPMLSVRKLVHDRHTVRFQENGGYIKQLQTGVKIPFFEHMGVYYLTMKIKPPEHIVSQLECEKKPVFSRPVR